MTTKEKIIEYFRNTQEKDEKKRKYEKDISLLSNMYSSKEGIQALKELMKKGNEYAYEAFFCLTTIFRHNRDFSDLLKLIKKAEKRNDLCNHVSFPHIRIMYETHSESLYDYDLLLNAAHQSACDMFDNSGYHHTFANAFATICEKCLPEDLKAIVDRWYDSALYCVNKAISLEPNYAKFYCTKARIVSITHHYEEASELILKAIDKENSAKPDYALLIGNYQYYRILIAMRKQQWLVDRRIGNIQPVEVNKNREKDIPRNYQNLRPYVFISYSHNDSSHVFSILNEMSKLGINYWYDKELETGSEWPEVLGEKILNCEMVMVMLSNSAVLSKNVRNEITMALNHKKKIMPVFLEDVELSPGAELQLRGLNWLLKYQMSAEMFRQKLCESLGAVQVLSPDTKQQYSLQTGSTTGNHKNSSKAPAYGIIEKFCVSKKDVPKECEDILVVSKNFIAVIDGATSKNDKRFNGKTGGRIAAEQIKSYLTSKVIDPDMDYKTAICRIQAKLQDYAKKNELEKNGIHLCASAVIYSIAKRQIWAVGDCQFILNNKHYTFYKKVDTILSETRSLAMHMLLQSGLTEDDLKKKDSARGLILDELKMQQYLENKDDEYGYSVFSSQGSVKDVSVTEVPLGSEIVLASDGYPELFTTLSESEARLKELIRLDPLCYKIYKSTKGLMENCKRFDDCSYIRFKVE